MRGPGTLGRPPFLRLVFEVFNVGGWLTHRDLAFSQLTQGDLALEACVDFLAVVEHMLIPARVRSEWARLKCKGLASIWAPACQDSSRVGNAGVGVISMRGAPVALPSFAALCELSVVTRGQPCLIVGDFNVEPTKIPCLAKGISAGLWVDLEASWAFAGGTQPAPTCKRAWSACGGRRRDFIVGCPLAAAVLSCKVQSEVGCSSSCC